GAERLGPLASRCPECDELAREDLPAGSVRGEPRGLDDGTAEVIALLELSVAVGHTDPDGQRVRGSAVTPLEPLLDGHRSLDGTRDAVEGDHPPVAQVLHLPPAVPVQRFAEQCEVLA